MQHAFLRQVSDILFTVYPRNHAKNTRSRNHISDPDFSRVPVGRLYLTICARAPGVWECALAAGRALIDHAGAVHFAAFQPVLERAVERPPVVESAEIGDRVSGALM